MRGRNAVITGGGRGVGAAVAARLAANGVTVIVAARTAEQIESVAEALRIKGYAAHAETCDVADPRSVERLAARAEKRFGSVDILVNNAGTALASALHK